MTFDHYIDKNIAYFHIAKTGGQSFIRFLMDEYDLSKLGIRRQRVNKEYRLESLRTKKELLGNNFDTISIFTTIRNPYAQVVSLYFFLVGYISQIDGEAPSICPELLVASYMSLEEFVEWYCNNFPSYFDFLNINGIIPPNVKIIRLEYVKEELGEIISSITELNLNVDSFPHINTTGMGDAYKQYMTRNLYDLINEKQSWVFGQGYYILE